MLALFAAAALAAAPPPHLDCPAPRSYIRKGGLEGCMDDKTGDGVRDQRSEKGVLLSHEVLVHGVPTLEERYGDDGRIQTKRTWADGKRDGEWEAYFLNGTLAWRRTYKDDALVTEHTFSKAGIEDKVILPLPDGGTPPGGGLAKELTGLVMTQQHPYFQYCFEKRAALNPKLAGKLTLTFVIDRDGKVSDAYLTDADLADPAVGECVMHHMRKTVEFPRPRGGGIVQVNYPLHFTVAK